MIKNKHKAQVDKGCSVYVDFILQSLIIANHFEFAMKILQKMPRATALTSPEPSSTGAMNFVFSPKMIKRATASCARLFPKAPARHRPIAEKCLDFPNKKKKNNIVNPLAKEPAAEKTKIYEKRVPEINPCARTFKKMRSKVSFLLKTERESRIGRFAKPKRRNGNGFGIAYSTAERNMQRAAKKEISFTRFSLPSMLIIYHIFQTAFNACASFV